MFEEFRERWRVARLSKNFWLAFVLGCAVAMAVEYGMERVLESDSAPGLSQSIFGAAGLYQWLIGAERKPLQRYTAVVKIDPEEDKMAIGSNDVCGQREQVAHMLCRIHGEKPKVIAIDKFYSTTNCGQKTRDLDQAVQEVSKDVRIVLGTLSMDLEVDGQERYYLVDSLQLTKSLKLTWGLVNIDPDTRKLPLQWWMYPSKTDAQAAKALEWNDTLALATAKGYDSALLRDRERLAEMVEKHRNPYVGFLREDDFHPMTVSEVLAGLTPIEMMEGPKPLFCPANDNPPENLSEMSGKVVVIGEVDPVHDVHDSVVGKMPGYLMQANFIEALLDDRYYRSMPVLDFVYGFAFLALLELILMVGKNEWVAMAGLFTLLVGAMIGMLWLTLRLTHWYVNPAAVGLAGIVVRLLGKSGYRAEKTLEEAGEKAKEEKEAKTKLLHPEQQHRQEVKKEEGKA